MERAKRYFGKVAAGVSGVVASASGAMAASPITITQPTLDYTELGLWVSTILGGIAAMWVVRKMIKTGGRS